MSTSSLLVELRKDPRFKDLLKEIRVLIPVPPLYKVSRKESLDSEQQISDWIYNSGRISQGNTILGFLIGETKE